MLEFPQEIVEMYKDLTPAYQKIYRIIKDSIYSGKLQTREKFTEEAVAQALGVSRTPVRTALQKLQAEGMLQNITRNNYGLKEYSAKEKYDLLSLAMLLEGNAAYLAALNGVSPEDLELLEEVNEMLSTYNDTTVRRGSLGDGVRDLHMEFHLLIAKASGNKYLYQAIVNTRTLMRSISSNVAYSEDNRTNYSTVIAPIHKQLIEALKARDPHQAELIMRYELDRAREIYKKQ